MTDARTQAGIELLPCPFCGGRANFYGNKVDFVPKWSVGCGDCDAKLDICEHEKQEAAKTWNTRALPVPDATEGRDKADYKIGWWLSGALEDPAVCAEMKADINAWFEAKAEAKELHDYFNPVSTSREPLPGELEVDAWVAGLCWQPIETAPKDVELLLGWWRTWPVDQTWECASGLAGSTKGGWLHGQATHWQPLPGPPLSRPHREAPHD